MIARNDECGCGSGRKFKKCCGRPDRRVTQQLLMKMLVMFAGFSEEGVYKVYGKDLDCVPADAALQVRYNGKDDCFELTSVKLDKPKILLPDKRIRI